MKKKSTYLNMAKQRPDKDQYIHFITNTGTQTYGWYRGDEVDITLHANKDGENLPIKVANIAAWRPVTMKPL